MLLKRCGYLAVTYSTQGWFQVRIDTSTYNKDKNCGYPPALGFITSQSSGLCLKCNWRYCLDGEHLEVDIEVFAFLLNAVVFCFIYPIADDIRSIFLSVNTRIVPTEISSVCHVSRNWTLSFLLPCLGNPQNIIFRFIIFFLNVKHFFHFNRKL